jgi:hypothetical protein
VATEAAWLNGNNLEKEGKGLTLTGLLMEGTCRLFYLPTKSKSLTFSRSNSMEKSLSLTSWNYIGHDPKQFRHYGPVAQEFFGAFGHDAVGTIGNSTTINSGDMEGILMVGVQALEKRTRQENNLLQQTIETLRAENTELKTRLEAIERRLGSPAIK